MAALSAKGAKRYMDAAAAVYASVTALVVEMEERVEARIGGAQADEVEDTEVLRGYGCLMMCISLPYTFGTGKLCGIS